MASVRLGVIVEAARAPIGPNVALDVHSTTFTTTLACSVVPSVVVAFSVAVNAPGRPVRQPHYARRGSRPRNCAKLDLAIS